MAHQVHFVDAARWGWRKRVRIIERPRGENCWEVVGIAPDETWLTVRCGAQYRTYSVRERLDSDTWRCTLEACERR